MAEKKVYHIQRQFIDPDPSVNSTLVTRVVFEPGTRYDPEKAPRPYLSASVTLSDCSRTIGWDFDDLEGALQKAEAVLAQWTSFTEALRLAISEFPASSK